MGRKKRRWHFGPDMKLVKRQERCKDNPSIGLLVACAAWDSGFVWCRR